MNQVKGNQSKMTKEVAVLWKLLMLPIMILVIFVVSDMGVKAAEPSTKTIKMKETVSGRQVVGNHTVLYNSLLKGETYHVLREDAKYFYIPFGNETVYLSKRYAEPVGKGKTPVTAKSKKSFITKKSVAVYTDANTSSRLIGRIGGDVRVPVFNHNKKFYKVNFGGVYGYVKVADLYPDPGVPVLMYHHLVEKKVGTSFAKNSSVLEVTKFKEQMDYLHKNEWIAVPIEVFEEWKNAKKNLPTKVVVISFDDGYKSTIKYAYPILKKYKMNAVSFLITSRMKEREVPWDASATQILSFQEMNATNDVFSYQHHTHALHSYHSKIGKSYLETETADAVTKDLIEGKRLIESNYNKVHEVSYLAYPYGIYTKSNIDVAKSVGIRMAFTIDVGNVQMSDDPYKMKRQRIHSSHTLKKFEKIVQGK